jgi:hypothetical protein
MKTLIQLMHELEAKYMEPMDTQKALNIIKNAQINLSQPLLETLIIMNDRPDAFTGPEMQAHGVVMAGFRKLLAPMD